MHLSKELQSASCIAQTIHIVTKKRIIDDSQHHNTHFLLELFFPSSFNPIKEEQLKSNSRVIKFHQIGIFGG